jgi:hypothetical protein
VLDKDDCPILPDPRKQKFYQLFVAKLQFAATWIRLDISFAVAQLARFCALFEKMHWAALHHLMEYLEVHPSFKLTYRKCSALSNGVTGFADFDWAISLSCRSTTGNLLIDT